MTNEDRLLAMKRKVTEAKSKVDQSKGALSQLEKRLESEFSVTTVEEANELVEKLTVSINQVEEEIAGIITELSENYDWE